MTTASPWDDTPPLPQRGAAALERLSTYLRTNAWQASAQVGLNPTQARVLELLATQSGPPQISWLARQLGVSLASASDTTQALVARGLVVKTRALHDARAVEVRLTPAGREVLDQLDGSTRAAEVAFARLRPDDQEQLYRGMLSLLSLLIRQGDFPVQRMCPECRFLRHVGSGEQPAFVCELVGQPLPAHLLRIDCPEFEPVTA